MPNRTKTKKARTFEEQQDERQILLHQYASLHLIWTGELQSDDPDWLLLFRLHYTLMELDKRHPWLKDEDQP